jgi:hypothetical protein
VASPTISVLQPKDLTGFHDSFTATTQGSYHFNRLFLFPSGFGLDTNFIGGQQSRPGINAGGGLLERVLAGPVAAVNSRSAGAGSYVDSPILGILQNELIVALAKSQRYKVLVPVTGIMLQDIAGIEAEKKTGSKRSEKPLDKEPTADFFLGSSIGIKSYEIKQSGFSGDNEATNFVEAIFANSTSPERNLRVHKALNVFRSFYKYKNTTTLSVVVNLYIAEGRQVIAAAYGLGVSQVDLSHGYGVAGASKETVRTEDLFLGGIKRAVQDALNNLSVAR